MKYAMSVRMGILSTTCAAALAASVVGCGSSNGTTGPAPGANDGGASNPNGPGGGHGGNGGAGDDGGGGATRDGGAGGDTGTDSGPALPDAKVIVAHAAPGLNGVRVCLAAGTMADGSDATPLDMRAYPDDDAKLPAGLSYPAIAPGAAVALPDVLAPAVTAKVIVPIVIDAASIASEVRSAPAEKTCAALLAAGGDGGVPAGKSWKLKPIAAQSLRAGATYVLAVTGCADPLVPQPSRCGPGIVPNVDGRLLTLDRAAVDASKVGVQVAHLSSAAQAVFDAPLGVTLERASAPSPADAGDGVDGGDDGGAPDAGSTVIPISSPALMQLGDFGPAPAAQIAGDVAQSAASYTVVVRAVRNGADVNVLRVPLTSADELGGATAAGYFATGASYTFLIVGDPHPTVRQPGDTGYDGHGYHVVVVPNDPPFGAN